MTIHHDARSRDDGLGWVSTALYPDERVRVQLHTGRRPAAPVQGHVVIAEHAVVPSSSSPRFLVPLGDRRIGARSLLAFNGLRPRPVRVARAAVAVLARLGLLELPYVPRLVVTAPAEVDASEISLTAFLERELGAGPLVGACGIRPPDPNRKPTLQLFDTEARPVGYAKVGWNPATCDLVAAEAAALMSVADGPAPFPIVPRVLFSGDWAGRQLVVAEPLPPDVRGCTPADDVPVTESLTVARRGGAPSAPIRLADSAFLGRLEASAASPTVTADAGDRLQDAVARLRRDCGTISLEFGDWHGDWVPWNLGLYDGRLVAWDWEHSGADMPIGSDVAHDAFQRRFVLDERSASDAARSVERELAAHASTLGLDEGSARVVLIGYLIEMWLRAHRLAAGGAGWNERLHPALLDEITRRTS